MSSTLIQRRVAAVASPRSALATAVAARRRLHRNQLDVHHRHHYPQTASRGLTHHTSGGGTNPDEHLRTPVQPQNPKHPDHHHNKDQHHAHRQHQHKQQTRRPSSSQAAQRVVAAGSSYDGDVDDDVRYSAMASQQTFGDAAAEHHQEWAKSQPSPEMRLRRMVERFGERHFVDELPSRTRKSVADAAAAGKGYVTAEDITRVVDNISDGKHGVTEEEAQAICEAWGTRRSAGEGGGGVVDGGVSRGDAAPAAAAAAAAAAVEHHGRESAVDGGAGGSKSGPQTGNTRSPTGGPSAPMPTIPKAVFLHLLEPPSKH